MTGRDLKENVFIVGLLESDGKDFEEWSSQNRTGRTPRAK